MDYKLGGVVPVSAIDRAALTPPERPGTDGELTMSGKVAVITGGSHGIGAGLVAGYRGQGWSVVASARTCSDRGNAAQQWVLGQRRLTPRRQAPHGDSAARAPAADPLLLVRRCTGKKQLLAWGYP